MDYVGDRDDCMRWGVVLDVGAVTFLDYPGDGRQGREEWATEHLLDQDDIAAWRAETEHERITHREMVRRWADDRAEQMGSYVAPRWGWWDQDADGNVTIVGGGGDDVDYPGQND